MIKKLFILSVLMIALQFGCAPVCENEFKSNSGNQQTNENQNQNGDSQTPDDKPKTPITITLVGADGNELKKLEATSGEKVLLSVEVENLSHWNTSPDGSGQSYNGTAVFDESVTLYAILLAENAHTIKYILDDGINNPQNPFSFTEEDYIGIKNPTKAGYTFLGWYDNEDFTGKPIKGWAAGDKTANVTLYAKWQKESDPATEVTITFDINGADITAPEAITATSGKSVKLPELTGVKFSHWNTSSDDSGLSYKGTAIFTESVTLYAILLAENAHTITYELDGGVNNPKNLFSFTEEDYIGIKNPTKTGYTFLGWYDNKNFTGKPIKGWAAGDKTANVTLYAKWEKEPEPAVEVTITFNANGANVKVPTAITSTSVENVELPELTGVKFSHWNTKADGSGQSYNGTAIFTESVTLYAILLAENAYTITYELNGGVNNPKNKFSFTEEDEMVALREPTRDGYKFVGWYETANFSGEAIKIWYEGEKTANVTLYAKWEKDNSNNGDEPVEGGSGVYSYTLDIEDISGNWGGRTTSPRFSVVLLTDEQVEVCKAASDFKVAPADNPEYQLGTYSNMSISDTSKTGDYAVYGSNPVNDVYHYYNGVAATITDKTFTLTVDMTKIVKTDLKALWAPGEEKNLTDDDIVDLTGRKPYVIALGDYLVDEDNYVFSAWSASVMKMEEGATFPTELIEDAPKIPTLSDMTVVCSNFGNFPITFTDGIATCEIEYSLANACWGQLELNGIEFGICIDTSWSEKFTGADVRVLGTPVAVEYNVSNNNRVNAQILIEESIYVLTINANDKTVKVEEVGGKVTAISVNSASHKTTYYTDDFLDVNGLTIEVTRDDGTTKTVNVTSRMVSGFDSYVVGTQTLTITYGGCTTTFDVEVHAVTAISVNSASHKTTYNFAESLDVSGLTIKVTGDDGTTKTVNVTSSMVSGFNPLELGTQTLTITYGGCTTTFDVEVHEIETETVEATASNVYDKISGLSSGYYLLKVFGEITSSTIADITSAMNYTSAKIILDLSETTGLTSTGSGTFGSGAFWCCDNLISITLPDGLTSIGSDAFTDCSNLINVVIPESVTEIGHDAFKYCSKLISAEIPEGVTTINEQTFAYCSSLTSVTIPESVTYIDYSAFQRCSNLTTVNYRGTQEQWEQISIDYDNTYLTNASVNYNYTGSVLSKVTAISVNSASHKTTYYTDDFLDVSGLTIEVTKEDATTKTVKVSSNMVSGFDSSVVGTQTLTITYGGCTTTFDIEIEERPTYTITFEANSGSGTMTTQTVGENLSCSLNANTFTAPDGYVFSHWNTKADGSGKTYYMNNSYSFSNDMTLYAIWEKVENNFDVSLPGSTSFSIYQSTDGNYVTFECSNWYNSYTWYIDGVKQSGTSREMTIDTSTMKVGIYTIMLKVKNNGTYWSETTTLMVNK